METLNLEIAATWLLTSGVRILLILIGLVAVRKAALLIAGRVLSRFGRRQNDAEYHKRTDTLMQVLRYLISSVLFAVAVITILGEIGIEIGPILAAAGVVGIAIGFGAQNLVRDLLSGFFILLEDQIRVGDVVEIAGKSGLVEQVNLRLVTLRDLAGNVHYVPSGSIGVVTNMTKGYSRYVFEIGVAYREDVDEVMDVMRQVDADMRADPAFADEILAPIEVLGVDAFAESAVVIKARTMTRPIKQWDVGREFNRRLKRRFDELDIEIPFPHLTLYAGMDKSGNAAPLRVDLGNSAAGREAAGGEQVGGDTQETDAADRDASTSPARRRRQRR